MEEKKVVADKQRSILKADEVSAKIINIIMEETRDYPCDDDPAEQIYLATHIMGSLLAKISISLESYGKTFGIPNLTCEYMGGWINKIAEEHIKANWELTQ